MRELLLSLLTWIGSHSTYNVDLTLPNITFTEPYNLCANYGIHNKGQCDAARLAGFYDKKFTIYLPNGFQVENAKHRSRLVHELVHYVQWANHENRDTCLGMLEVEAYELQHQWGKTYQLNNPLDPLKEILLLSSCDD